MAHPAAVLAGLRSQGSSGRLSVITMNTRQLGCRVDHLRNEANSNNAKKMKCTYYFLPLVHAAFTAWFIYTVTNRPMDALNVELFVVGAIFALLTIVTLSLFVKEVYARWKKRQGAPRRQHDVEKNKPPAALKEAIMSPEEKLTAINEERSLIKMPVGSSSIIKNKCDKIKSITSRNGSYHRATSEKNIFPKLQTVAEGNIPMSNSMDDTRLIVDVGRVSEENSKNELHISQV